MPYITFQELIFSDFFLLRFIHICMQLLFIHLDFCVIVHYVCIPCSIFPPPMSIWIEIELPDLASKNIGHPAQFEFQINIGFLNINLSQKNIQKCLYQKIAPCMKFKLNQASLHFIWQPYLENEAAVNIPIRVSYWICQVSLGLYLCV